MCMCVYMFIALNNFMSGYIMFDSVGFNENAWNVNSLYLFILKILD